MESFITLTEVNTINKKDVYSTPRERHRIRVKSKIVYSTRYKHGDNLQKQDIKKERIHQVLETDKT